MDPIQNLTGLTLFWSQPHMSEPVYELSRDERLLAVLAFKNAFGSLAEGITDAGIFSFKRQGFLKTQITVRLKGDEQNLAVYHTNTWSGGGTLELPDGQKFKVNSNFWESQYEISDTAEKPIIRYHNIGGFKLHGEMVILSESGLEGELPWMVLLGWYLAVMMSREGELVAALF